MIQTWFKYDFKVIQRDSKAIMKLQKDSNVIYRDPSLIQKWSLFQRDFLAV